MAARKRAKLTGVADSNLIVAEVDRRQDQPRQIIMANVDRPAGFAETDPGRPRRPRAPRQSSEKPATRTKRSATKKTASEATEG